MYAAYTLFEGRSPSPRASNDREPIYRLDQHLLSCAHRQEDREKFNTGHVVTQAYTAYEYQIERWNASGGKRSIRWQQAR